MSLRVHVEVRFCRFELQIVQECPGACAAPKLYDRCLHTR